MARSAQLETLRAVDALLTESEVATTPEIAARLGISRHAAWRRLDRLAKRGYLERRTSVFPQTFAPLTYWHLTEQGREAVE